MWFKNVRSYWLTQDFPLSAEELHDKLNDQAFTPCSPAQPLSVGFVPPLGGDSEMLVHAAQGRLLLCLKREEKILPASVIREQLEDKIEHIETEEARKVYRKERLTLKDEITIDLLPRAFSRNSRTFAIIDTKERAIFIDAASAARAEDLLSLLREALGSLPVVLPEVNQAPKAVMTGWITGNNLPQDFELGQDCELREPGDEGSVVRCRGVELSSEEVQGHLDAGREISRIAVSWDERVSLLIAEDLVLRRLKFTEELMKENEDLAEADDAARIDADFALLSSTLAELHKRLFALFGGRAQEE